MERYVYIGEKEMCKTSFPKNGVFWIIEGKLLAFAFEEEIYPEGIAKSGTTYNHKKLWKAVHPKGCGEPYNYYPRGRVHITKDGTAHLFLSPHITAGFVPEIKVFFGISGDMKIHYDHTPHYYCYLDEGWRSYT